MKFFLIILFGLYTFLGNTDELKRESSGFSETEEFKFENNTVIHYKNKTTWKDNLGNYGLSNCLGLIVTDFNKDGKWSEPVMLGPEINATQTEFGASVSPDGKYLFFHRRVEGNGDIYWVSSEFMNELR